MVSGEGVEGQNGAASDRTHGDVNRPERPPEPKKSGNGSGAGGKQVAPAALPQWWSIVKEALEGVSLVAVIATMIFVGLQWKEMAKQYKLMTQQLADAKTSAADQQKATDRALKTAESQADSLAKLADANKTMADAAVQSLKRNERAFRVSQRPWLSMDDAADLDGKPPFVGNKSSIVVVSLKNTGHSPALNVHLRSCSVFRSKTPGYEECPPNVRDAIVIGAGSKGWVQLKIGPFSDDDLAALKSRAKHLWILTLATWSDQFGTTYHANFCSVVNPDTETFVNCESGKNTPRQEQP